jgi:hypothetical protein
MDEKTTQAVKERFQSLPKTIQDAILSSDYQNTLIEIGKKYGLTVGQLGILEQETTLVMMGLTSPNSYQSDLQSQMGAGVDSSKIGGIVDEVNNKVFFAIRELLKLMNLSPEEVAKIEKEGEEEKVMQGAGVEVTKVPTTSVPYTAPIREPNRSDLLKGIENPPKGSGLSLAEQKLAGTFSMPTKETSYVPKSVLPPVPKVPSAPITPVTPVAPVAPTSEKPSSDSYREPI